MPRRPGSAPSQGLRPLRDRGAPEDTNSEE